MICWEKCYEMICTKKKQTLSYTNRKNSLKININRSPKSIVAHIIEKKIRRITDVSNKNGINAEIARISEQVPFDEQIQERQTTEKIVKTRENNHNSLPILLAFDVS